MRTGTLATSAGPIGMARVAGRPESRPWRFRQAPISRRLCRAASAGDTSPGQGPSAWYRKTGSKLPVVSGRASVQVAQLRAELSQK